MSIKQIKIAIVEDNSLYRKSLKQGLALFPNFEVVHELANALNIHQAFIENTPHVVLMDINMPGISGIDAVKEISDNFLNTQCIMLTVFEDLDKVIKSMQNGAKGYLLKNKDSINKIAESIEVIFSGQYTESFPLNGILAKKVMTLFLEREKTLDDKLNEYHLTARQKEILIALYNGRAYKQIAADLNVSIETIYTHIKNIYPKLNINSRNQIKQILG